jgi:Flp pilus assembly CpaE family ATPase
LTGTVDILKRVGLFAGLEERDLRKLATLVTERHFTENQVLFKQGGVADALYLIADGRVKVSATDRGGHEKVLTFSGAGDVLGEMGLLSGGLRSATAVAVTRGKVLKLAKDDFDALVDNDVGIMRELLQVVTRRREVTDLRAHQEATAGMGAARGILTVVFSPRGGAGKSMIATNLAVSLAESNPERTVLVDLDVAFGQVGLLLNLSPRTALSAISANSLRQMDRETLEFYLTRHADSSLRVLVSTLRPEEAELVTGEHVRAALDILRRHFDHVVVDTRRSFSDVNLTSIDTADAVLLVCTPDRVAVRGVRECQRILADVLHVPRERCEIVLNHPLPYRTVSTQQLEEMLGSRFTSEVPYGGDAPARAALEGYPLITRWPGNPASKVLAGIAAVLQQRGREAAALGAGRVLSGVGADS